MSRPRLTSVITCIPLAVGCSSYHYMRDITPELQTSRQEYVVNNPGNHFNDDIEVGRVRKGMSRLQVRSTWGEPDQLTHRTTNAETWSYQENEPGRGTSVFHLLFTGELLTQVDVVRHAQYGYGDVGQYYGKYRKYYAN